MSRHPSLSPEVHAKVIQAWYSRDAVSEISRYLQVSPSHIYRLWAQAKRSGKLPLRLRSEGNIYPATRAEADMKEPDICVPNGDPLLARLHTHHRPGHGEMVIASTPVIVSPPPW